MNNSLTNLNETLFEQLSRLNSAKTQDDLAFELNRAKAITGISKEIIDGKRLMLEITKHADDCNLPTKEMPQTLRLELS